MLETEKKIKMKKVKWSEWMTVSKYKEWKETRNQQKNN